MLNDFYISNIINVFQYKLFKIIFLASIVKVNVNKIVILTSIYLRYFLLNISTDAVKRLRVCLKTHLIHVTEVLHFPLHKHISNLARSVLN